MRVASAAHRALSRSRPTEDEGQPALFAKGERGTGRRSPREGEKRQRYSEEEARQKAIVKALRLAGYLVHVTSQHRRPVRCPREGCGKVFYPAGGMGEQAGCGDLLVTHTTRWPLNTWLMLECKAAAKSPVRPEQKVYRDLGRLRVVWTVEQAVEAVREFEAAIGVREEYRCLSHI